MSATGKSLLRKVVVVVGLLVPMALAPVARAEDPLFVGWTELLPGLTAGYDPYSENLCKKGHENCVHSVINEMERRFRPYADSCDHRAMFAIAYLRTTEEYHRFWHEGHFAEPNFLNHYDAVFAEYYFRAEEAWQRGDLAAVPAAWRIAFEAARDRTVSGWGDAVLGMNAHINRDLPFVLESIGLVAPDGTSRKADHDTVNQFLNRVADALLPEMTRRFDPTVDDSDVPGTTADNMATFQLIPGWREEAWRNAERLKAAATPAERAVVAQQIEDNAAAQAEFFRGSYAYNALSSFDADDRAAYCAAHHWDP